MQHSVRVAIADLELPYRAGLRAALPQNEFEVVCAVATLESLESRLAGDNVDVVLVDQRLVDEGAVGRLARLAVAVAVVTTDPAPESLLATYRQGALAYLPRELRAGELSLIVRDLAQGAYYAPPDLVFTLLQRLCHLSTVHRAPNGQYVRLSPRQEEVIALRERGLTTTDIARKLCLSPITVRRHLSEAARRGYAAAPAA